MITRRSLLGAGALAPLAVARDNKAMTSPTSPNQLRGLGFPIQYGVQDGSPASGGVNINPYLPGTGWDVIFTPQALAVYETEFECYQIALDGPIGSSAVVMLDGHEHSYIQTAWANTASTEPAMLIRYGQTVQFCWNFAFTAGPYNRTTNIQPRVTMWLRRRADPLAVL